jgi:hypothetical protein
MKMKSKDNVENRDCDRPDIRDSFKDGKCSEEQIIKCHGHEFLEKLKKEGN